MAWTQKNSGARVEFRFCLLRYHYTALCTVGGREAALFYCYSKDGFPFSLAGVMDCRMGWV